MSKKSFNYNVSTFFTVNVYESGVRLSLSVLYVFNKLDVTEGMIITKLWKSSLHRDSSRQSFDRQINIHYLLFMESELVSYRVAIWLVVPVSGVLPAHSLWPLSVLTQRQPLFPLCLSLISPTAVLAVWPHYYLTRIHARAILLQKAKVALNLWLFDALQVKLRTLMVLASVFPLVHCAFLPALRWVSVDHLDFSAWLLKAHPLVPLLVEALESGVSFDNLLYGADAS